MGLFPNIPWGGTVLMLIRVLRRRPTSQTPASIGAALVPRINRLPTAREARTVFPQNIIDCFVVKPAQEDALASSTDKTRRRRLQTRKTEGEGEGKREGEGEGEGGGERKRERKKERTGEGEGEREAEAEGEGEREGEGEGER